MAMRTRTCLALLLVLGCLPALVTGQACRAKTMEEKLADVRKTEGCADAEPTDCKCEGNKQKTVVDCSAKEVTQWDSAGQKCVYAYPDKDADWTRHKWEYPQGYGEKCGAQPEPGSYACTLVADKEHSFNASSPGYNTKTDTADWCAKVWCYVNPCECNKNFASSSWFAEAHGGMTSDGKNLYYSYDQCGAKDTFTAGECAIFGEFGCAKETAADDCIWDEDAQPLDAAGKPKKAEVEVSGAEKIAKAPGFAAVLLFLAAALQ